MTLKQIFGVLGLALCLLGSAHAEAKYSFATTPGQLPKTVVPTRYSLAIQPDPKTLTFQGLEVAKITVKAPTKTITLNELGLVVSKATLDIGEGRAQVIPTVNADDKAQTLTLTLPKTITPGPHTLAIVYSGKIGLQPQGLFGVKYQTPAGKPKLMFGTQMEPTDARRMFPCWDEPAFKATYQLTAVVPQSFMAVSNTPVSFEKPAGNGLKNVVFAPTPPMASYLVVLCAGEFEAYTGQAAGVKLRVVTTEGKKAQGAYAMSVMEKILPYYNQYFGVKYPLPKLDLIAVPGGFQGAMENWGGITYNENIILYDPKTSSEDTKQAIFNVVSHETAHQWSGDLVTMAWWDNLWLNEGFASWMADKASDHFNPAWHVLDRAAAEKDGILESDSYTTTHPIQQAVADPAQAAAAFDEITYQKGEAVIRMFENYLGPDVFQAGIQKYMRARKYSSSTTADLWDALGQVSGKPMTQIAAGWTEQPGFPVVLAHSIPGGGILLSQERFTVDTSNPVPETWQVPIAYEAFQGAKSRTAETVLLFQGFVTLPTSVGSEVALNAGNKGFYRVQYAPALFAPLAAHVESLPPADRIGLLGDTWALVKVGRVPVTSFLDLANSTRNDTTLAVEQQTLGSLEEIDVLQRGLPGRAAFQAYLRGVLAPRFARLGWDAKPGETSDTSLLRSGLITELGTLGDPSVVAEARRRFAAYVKDQSSLPANLIGPTLEVVARYADQAAYNQLLTLAQTTPDYRKKVRFYRALSGALDPKLARQTLNLTLSPQLATVPQAGLRLIQGVAFAGEQPDLALSFFRQHQGALLANQDALMKVFAVPTLYGAFSDTAHADALLAYAKANLPPDAAPQIAKTAAHIRFAAALKARLLPEVDRWVAARSKSASAK